MSIPDDNLPFVTRWFVVFRYQNGSPLPMLSFIDAGWPELALFDTEEEAQRAGSENILGKAYGFEVYEW
jgi:hypothetical protein